MNAKQWYQRRVAITAGESLSVYCFVETRLGKSRLQYKAIGIVVRMDLSLFCVIPLILIVSFPSGEAVMCFECNSGEIYQHEACANLVPTSTDYLKNCSDLGLREGLPYERCRVMVQDVEGEVRIVRSCATWPDKEKTNRCVDRTGTSKIKIRYCECEGDNCNGSSGMYGSLVVSVVAFVSLLLANSMLR